MNRINTLFQNKKENILSIYFTAGFPKLEDTNTILCGLEEAGVDLVEIGIPFSDPVADGPVIQQASLDSLRHGMSVRRLFEQLQNIRNKVSMPLVLMSYFNPVLQFGVEEFCVKCCEVGIDGLIIPDLPLEEYEEKYKQLFEQYGLKNILLITPLTSEQRLLQLDAASDSFIYMVSSSSTTGAKQSAKDFSTDYFRRVQQLKLKNPRLVGFGIANSATFHQACQYAQGAIVGSAFVQHVSSQGVSGESIKQFVNQLLDCDELPKKAE